jgi:hypothetical protein
MAKKPTVLEWTILSEDERDWGRYLHRLPNPEPALPRTDWRKWQWWGVTTVLSVLLCGSAFILWRQALEGIAQIEGELYETVKLQTRMELNAGNVAVNMLDERIPKNWQRSVQDEQAHLPLAFDEGATVTAAGLVFDKDIAAVEVVLNADSENATYRQTRFYRRTDEGWVRAAPDINLWGPSRRLETDYFVFEFQQRDAQAVAAVAAEVDTLYTTMLTNFGVPVALAEPKLRIVVSVIQTPGTIPTRVDTDDPFIVPSPALYLAPIRVTEADLLAQAVALPLIDHVSLQAMRRYALQQEWPSLLGGLRLWQLWDLDLPLSAWQDEVVRWVYGDVYAANYGQPFPLPERYVELCVTHALWMESPQQIKIPLTCEATDGAELWLTKWSPLLASMDQTRWGTPLADAEWMPTMYGIEHPWKGVALATIFEYAVVAYGREQVPALIAGFGTHEGWETLLPGIAGVSAADFEAGWRNYLVQQYNASLDR